MLRNEGVGSDFTSIEGITAEEEKQLWTTGVFNLETPTGLLHATFYCCGKCFCLRRGQEHRNLALSQLKRKQNGMSTPRTARKINKEVLSK